MGTLQDLGLVLGDEAADIQIEELALFVDDQTEFVSLGQRAPVHFDGLDRVRLLDRLQCLADPARLPARFAFALAPGLLGPVRILRGRLAAVGAVGVEPAGQNPDQHHQQLNRCPQRGRDRSVVLELLFDACQRGIDIEPPRLSRRLFG